MAKSELTFTDPIVSVDGDDIIIKIPSALSCIGTQSKTGKSKVVSSTHGFTTVLGSGGLRLSLNLIR